MIKKELTNYLITKSKQQQKDKEWIKNNRLTVEQFLKPYLINPIINLKTPKK